MTFGSCFAGIGGFDRGFELAGLECSWQIEIDPACRRVLAHHWPAAILAKDVRTCGRKNLPKVDVICGGFPCQDLSVAGQRKGFDGERSILFYQLARLAFELQPKLVVWENVPGLLSAHGGRDAVAVLREFARIGFYGGWRVLDSQYFGLAQRRERVFGVFARGRAGARRAAEILAFTDSSKGNPAARKKAGEGVAATLRGRFANPGVNQPGRGGEDDSNLVCQTLGAHHPRNCPDDPLVVGAVSSKWAKGTGGPAGDECYNLVAPTVRPNNGENSNGGSEAKTLCFQTRIARNGRGQPKETVDALTSSEGGAHADSKPHIFGGDLGGIRRLMPVECLRLQGFPDSWLNLDPPLKDGPKYRMIGNAVSVNVAEWIGRRIVATQQEEPF